MGVPSRPKPRPKSKTKSADAVEPRLCDDRPMAGFRQQYYFFVSCRARRYFFVRSRLRRHVGRLCVPEITELRGHQLLVDDRLRREPAGHGELAQALDGLARNARVVERRVG